MMEPKIRFIITIFEFGEKYIFFINLVVEEIIKNKKTNISSLSFGQIKKRIILMKIDSFNNY